jgi:phage-related protein
MFRKRDGRVPFLEWFRELPDNAKDQCLARLELLRAEGHELRRPAAENLGEGIYELRAKVRGVNYRILYFFHGRQAIVLSHGLVKQQANIPLREIDLAQARKLKFEADPELHTYEE